MKKIVSLFQRNHDGDGKIRDEVSPGAEWVAAGEGRATVKHDGTCCLVRNGKLYKRYEIKVGGKPPPNFEAACEVDPITGKQQGWVPVDDRPENAWHVCAISTHGTSLGGHPDGTYELCGPKVQGNPEGRSYHTLIPHGSVEINAPRTFEGLREFLKDAGIEGIVWHHPDGRMIKIKAKDFGWKRAAPATA